MARAELRGSELHFQSKEEEILKIQPPEPPTLFSSVADCWTRCNVPAGESGSNPRTTFSICNTNSSGGTAMLLLSTR